MSSSANEYIGEAPELRWVSIDMILVDSKYQREIVKTRVKKIVENFKWAYFGAVTLAEQPSGLFAVYDGQHRVMAADQHPAITEVPAIIVKLDSSREEADAFVTVNKQRSAISAIDTYWAGVHAGTPEMIQIKTLLESVGCEIVRAHGDNALNKTSAVGAVGRAIKYYGEGAVKRAFLMLRKTWPNERGALRGILISSMARVFRDSQDLDQDRLCRALTKFPLNELTASAEAIRKLSGGSADLAISKAIAGAYNRGLQTGKIDLGGK